MHHTHCIGSFSDKNSSFPADEDDKFPEGYLEALEVNKALAIDLLSLAINKKTIERCWGCIFWIGRCSNGKINKIAIDYACSDFKHRKQEAKVK